LKRFDKAVDRRFVHIDRFRVAGDTIKRRFLPVTKP